MRAALADALERYSRASRSARAGGALHNRRESVDRVLVARERACNCSTSTDERSTRDGRAERASA